MKKTILLLVLLFTFTQAFCQETEWSGWASISCYKGFQASVRKLGYVKTVNQYAHQARIKNNYRQKVSFDLFWTVAGERLSIGRVTLNPNDVYEHTSRYFSKDASMMFVEVDKVSFGDKLNCYASCDNGTPNQPNCDTKITTTQGQATTATATAHNTAGGTSTTVTGYPVQTPTNTAGAQQQQDIQQALQQAQQQQAAQMQTILNSAATQLGNGIAGLVINSHIKKETKRQETLARFVPDKELIAGADSGDFLKQVKLAQIYVDYQQFRLAEFYYELAIKNPKEPNDSRNNFLDEYMATLSLQGKSKEIAATFKYIKDNHISNANANLSYALLALFCGEFSADALGCNEDIKAEGVRQVLALKADSAWAKSIFYYMQVTCGYEKYGVPKNKEEGLKNLELMKKDGVPGEIAFYYLGLIYMNGTADISKNERKAIGYLIKSAYHKGGQSDLKQAPEFHLDDTKAYFNFRLLSYIKMIVTFARLNAYTMDLPALRVPLLPYRNMIPEGDKQYFPGFWQ